MNSFEDHYKKYLDVYEKIATVNKGKTVWIPTDSHSGWYVDDTAGEDSEGWNNGYPKSSRPQVLPDDLSSDVERTAYTTISYAEDDAYETKYYKETDDGIEWMDNDVSRLPDYGDMKAWAIFVDIDIKDDYKKRPLPDEHKKVIVNRLNLWVKAFSEMAGGEQHIQLLDSGGGMYVFIPPSCLSPIADKYERDDLNLIFNEIGKRVRSVVGKLDDLICSQDNAPKDLFSADKVQNKNRQFKTVGSIHKSINAVVHPVNPSDIRVTHKKVEDVTDQDIVEAKEWVDKFTSDSHRTCVESIVKYLFQGDFTNREDMDISFVEGDDWKDILDRWVEDKKESIELWESSIEEQSNIDSEKLNKQVTQDKKVAREAVRRVNNEKLKKYIVEYLGEDKVYEKTGSEMDLFPFWRSQNTKTGRSAFYDEYKGSARFTDKADGTSRNIVYWVALELTFSDNRDENMIKSPSENLTGEQYAKCIRELRRRGEDIPILITDVDEDEKLPLWDIRKVGEQLNIIDYSEDKPIKTSDWNEVIDFLNENDIVHNRSKQDYLEADEIIPPTPTSYNNEYSKDEIYSFFYNDKGYYEGVFNSKDEYNKIIEETPENVVIFKYEGDISGSGEDDSVYAGVFSEQDDKTVTLVRFDPLITQSYNHIKNADDLPGETNESLDKTKLQIYKPTES